MRSFTELIGKPPWIGLSLCRAGAQGEGVDRAGHLSAENRIDHAVLLDGRLARELRRADQCFEVVSAAGGVSHLYATPGQRLLDPGANLIGCHAYECYS